MSTTVSNPYSFNITNNRSFTSPSIAANLPNSDTLLLNITKEMTQNYNLTIPAGVKVIRCIGTVTCGSDISEGENTVTAEIKNNSNSKYWVNENDVNVEDQASVDFDIYIGVSSNKTYNLYIDISTWGMISTFSDIDVKIYYSSSINNQTPTITDY